MKTPLPLLLLCLIMMALTSSCEKTDPQSESPGPEVAEQVASLGMEASDALMKSLGGQLKAALANGGPASAVEICQQVALPMTASTGEAFDHVTVRRTSLRHRNPANAPDELDREVLAQLEASLEERETPPEPVLRWEGETARFYRPLMMQEVCLNCHGDATGFPADLSAKLAELYPNDKAVGYAAGDLRGVIRVDVDWKHLP